MSQELLHPLGRAAPAAAPVGHDYAVVIPAYNEAENIGALIDEIYAAMSGSPPAAVVIVDDGSSDGTEEQVRRARERHSGVKLVRHSGRFGQSAALRSGARAAAAAWIVTMDGDGQNDPVDIASLLAAWTQAGVGAGAGARPPGLVAGIRRRRRDSWSKRLASRAANAIRRAVLHDACPDTGCGLKLIRRDILLDLPFFAGLHRFLPALVKLYGHRIEMVTVSHRPRRAGTTKYNNLSRAIAGFFDLLGVFWLTRRTPLPPHDQVAI